MVKCSSGLKSKIAECTFLVISPRVGKISIESDRGTSYMYFLLLQSKMAKFTFQINSYVSVIQRRKTNEKYPKIVGDGTPDKLKLTEELNTCPQQKQTES